MSQLGCQYGEDEFQYEVIYLLIKAFRDCIDHVILHGLCYLQEHNHSPQYYQSLTQYQPEWKLVKSRLDNLSDILLNQ